MKHDTIIRSIVRAIDAHAAAKSLADQHGFDWRCISVDHVAGRATIYDHDFGVLAVIGVQ